MSAAASDRCVKDNRASTGCSWTFGLLSDGVLWLMLWCLLCELPNRIFFPALVAMGFSGLEVFLAVHLFTALIGIKLVWRFCANWISVLLAASLPAFYYYGELEDHYERSIYIGVAVIFLSFAAQGALFHSPERSNRLLWGQNLSLLLLISVRFACKSALPVWSFHRGATPQWKNADPWTFDVPQFDKYMACVGLLAVMYFGVEKLPAMHPHTPTPTLRWVIPALALGTNQFLLFWLFTCHSVVPRWVGVDSTNFGFYIILGLFFGFALSSQWRVVQSQLFNLVGLVGGYQLYYGDPLFGFLGGLAVAVFASASTMYTYVSVFKCASVKGRTLFLGQLTFVFLEFTTVWNIAYMFLDLGDTFRESPHYPLFFSLVCISLNNMITNTPAEREIKNGGIRTVPLKALVALFVLVTCPCYVYRYTYAITHPHKVDVSSDEDIKVMIWNVHTGYADNGYDNYVLAANFAQDMKAGVIAILESDQARVVTGNRDQVEFLGASLGFEYHSYGVQTRDSTWGCSFISLYPVKASNITVLPSPYGTRSCLIDAILDVKGNDFNVIVSHFSTEEFPEDLKLQTNAVSQMTQDKNEIPLTVLCYITSAPMSALWYPWSERENYNTLVTKGTLKDPDPNDFDRWCQYIFYKNTRVKSFAHVDTGYMSDTEALVADIEFRRANSTAAQPEDSSVDAKFYKYFIDRRELKYWYTKAIRDSENRPLIW
ncbi:hypothetical protein SARC_01349 [Sphaeroforma arctica JP610]|uniref:Endonuclease/exonuclease/phosphatase domain-containing protein n=1 Tax=Sphaeroforma arctica JP610 TaxID=667725 RepID=A0A0L0GC89_9EUKA|nr:hypothetical protein SARC_01349 [Sphaeroforma arctica JP610]KNC86521.1 hypothetical protein SARC_01349 [Sphaeroforma arctica JP610]|eukprot:XP_014160423.1 hypothetical protein SARC_01349 [Sphaeroforma arctica JP610]